MLFQTEEMPFPFKKSSNEDDDMNAPEIVEGEADVIQEDESEEAFNDSEDKPADSEEEKEEDPKS